MTKFLFFFSIFFIACFNSFSQKSINDYKYIIIPNKYEFLKQVDQYQLNSLTKFLFNKYGYIAIFSNETFPKDLSLNGCLGLTADVVEENSFLKTKLRIDLKDCKGTVIQSSVSGESREKQFATAYNFALRDAFETYKNMDYKYIPNEVILAESTAEKSIIDNASEQEIVRLKEELKSLKEDNISKVEINEPSVEDKDVEEQLYNDPSKEVIVTALPSKDLKSEVLYAQEIENGYQIVDSTPKVVMILYPTSAKDVFTVKDKNAIVFKKENQWIYSENNGKTTQETILNIKF